MFLEHVPGTRSRNTKRNPIASLLHLDCHLISISNLNLLGLFSTERGKRFVENNIIDWDSRMKKWHSKCNRLYQKIGRYRPFMLIHTKKNRSTAAVDIDRREKSVDGRCQQSDAQLKNKIRLGPLTYGPESGEEWSQTPSTHCERPFHCKTPLVPCRVG